MTFDEWLAIASEDDKREASEYRHHYPVELTVWDVDDSRNPYNEHNEVMCGCDPAFKPYGHHLEQRSPTPADSEN